jgi:MFS family permease
MTPESLEEDRYYRQNVIGICGVEFFWGLGLPIVVESTFLQLFMKNLGASSLAIGSIPMFYFVGSSLFALWASHLTDHLPYKRKAVILLHLVSALSLFLFGLCFLWLGHGPAILPLFLCSYAVFSICLGMTLPVWLNYLVKILSEQRSVSGLAYMMIAQNIAKLISSLLIVRLVDDYAFSYLSSALTFIGVGGLFALGSLFFLWTREPHPSRGHAPAHRSGLVGYSIGSMRHVLTNRNFLFFLAGDLDFYVVVTVISFYAAYATGFGGISPAVAAGVFVACIYVGAIVVNVWLGSLGFLSLKSKCVWSKIASLAALSLLLLSGWQGRFYLASFLFGMARGTRMIVLAPAVKKLSGLSESTRYFAVAPILTLPFAVGFPLLFGHFLDYFSRLGAAAYQWAFGAAMLLIAVSLVCILKTDFSPPTAKTDTV